MLEGEQAGRWVGRTGKAQTEELSNDEGSGDVETLQLTGFPGTREKLVSTG